MQIKPKYILKIVASSDIFKKITGNAEEDAALGRILYSYIFKEYCKNDLSIMQAVQGRYTFDKTYRGYYGFGFKFDLV
jgi:hypothetical protein